MVGIVEVPDPELLRRLLDGDEAAFSTLVRRYQSSLLRLAGSLVGSRAIAEEAVQDTWVGVIRGVERFEGRSSFKTWLFRILVNRARSAATREHRTESLDGDDLPAVARDRFGANGAWAAAPSVWADEAEDRLVAEKLARRARAFLEDLPQAQRQAILLRDVEGLAAVEVCETLGVTGGNLRVLLHRGRAKLRNMLEAEIGKG
jgi:RNA polymerase sigma-70 factor (ECF subfamily)